MRRITLFLLAFVGGVTLAGQAPQKESAKDAGPLEYIFKQTLTGYTGKVFDVAFSPDGQLLAVGSEDKTVLWDAQTGALVRTLTGFSSVAFSPDARMLASRSPDNKTVKLWDVQTGALVRSLTGHTKGVNSLAFSPGGHLLVSATARDKVELWDVQTGTLVRTLTGHTASLIKVAFSPDGRQLAAYSLFLEVRVWDVETGALIRQFDQQKLRFLKTHIVDIARASAFSPDAHLLACSTFHNYKTVVIWDVQTGAVVRTLTGHTEAVESVAFRPDGQLLASGSNDKTVKLWNVQTGAEVQTLTGHTGDLEAVAFSPDGRLLASGSDDMTVRLWRRAE